MTTETTLQNFLDKHIEATLNRTSGRWEYIYYPAGDNTNPTRFHTAPLPDGGYTINEGVYIPQMYMTYHSPADAHETAVASLFSINKAGRYVEVGRPDTHPAKMTRQEAQLTLVGHLANDHGRDIIGSLDEFTEGYALYLYALTRSRNANTEADHTAASVKRFLMEYLEQ